MLSLLLPLAASAVIPGAQRPAAPPLPCSTSSASPRRSCTRREAAALLGGVGAITASRLPAAARVPGSQDVDEAMAQIRDAAEALRALRRDWEAYAVIDSEGRAGNIDAARRILGGVAPQRGEAAIAVAKVTPLYRIDGAFAAVRKAALEGNEGWGASLDIEDFVETSEDIVLALKKADDSFYGVVFASKGSTMLSSIYREARSSVDQAVVDFDRIIRMLKDAGAPGF